MQRSPQKNRRFLWYVLSLTTFVAIGYVSYHRIRESTLDSWTRTIQRPGFSLLEKRKSDSHFYAVFKTDDSRIAICYKALTNSNRIRSSTIGIQDSAGNDLVDNIVKIEPLERNIWYGPICSRIVDGDVYSLRNYRGTVHISFSSAIHDSNAITLDDNELPMFSTKLEW